MQHWHLFCVGEKMGELCEDGAKGWWRSVFILIAVWSIPAAVMFIVAFIVAFVGPFVASQVLSICALWSTFFWLHLMVMVLERALWHYCVRQANSVEHAQDQFKSSLASIEIGFGM